MKSGQGFLLVFSITSNSSLRELTELREQLVRIKDDERVPLVLVGNKADLEEHRAVSRSKAYAVSQSWGNKPYYETSARRRTNVDEVFIDLCRQIIRKDMDASRPTREDEDYRGDGEGHEDESRRRRRRRKRKDRMKCNIL